MRFHSERKCAQSAVIDGDGNIVCEKCGNILGFIYHDENIKRVFVFKQKKLREVCKRVGKYVEDSEERRERSETESEWARLLDNIRSWGEQYQDVLSVSDGRKDVSGGEDWEGEDACGIGEQNPKPEGSETAITAIADYI